MINHWPGSEVGECSWTDSPAQNLALQSNQPCQQSSCCVCRAGPAFPPADNSMVRASTDATSQCCWRTMLEIITTQHESMLEELIWANSIAPASFFQSNPGSQSHPRTIKSSSGAGRRSITFVDRNSWTSFSCLSNKVCSFVFSSDMLLTSPIKVEFSFSFCVFEASSISLADLSDSSMSLSCRTGQQFRNCWDLRKVRRFGHRLGVPLLNLIAQTVGCFHPLISADLHLIPEWYSQAFEVFLVAIQCVPFVMRLMSVPLQAVHQ